MTKKIRVENADTSNHTVLVTVQNKQADGSWLSEPSVALHHAAQMHEQYIHSGRRVIVEELDPNAEKPAGWTPPPVA